ncbi:MAG: hypothetical protein PHP13_06065 [Methanomicrobium sp.]|nr:hypothetical protein [Methanomicrobium sp.]
MQEIKKVGVFSVAKIFASVSLVVGLIAGLLYMIFGGITTFFMSDLAFGTAVDISTGLVGIVVMTFGCAVVGFIYGAIVAVIYNIAAGWFGGVEVRIE